MFGLSEETIAQLQGVFANHPEISEVRIYGSRAQGTEKRGSDVDLALVASQDITAKVKGELDALPTPYLFDVTDYASITHLPLKEHIDRVGKSLYQREL